VDDNYFLNEAYKYAKKAEKLDEVPIGCVIVKDNRILSNGCNKRERTNDATAHAEILAIKKACKKLKSWRLENCVLYVTLQPCTMCFGAILNARIKKVVYGAKDLSCAYDADKLNLNHKTEFVYLENLECGKIISDYFANKRIAKETVDS